MTASKNGLGSTAMFLLSQLSISPDALAQPPPEPGWPPQPGSDAHDRDPYAMQNQHVRRHASRESSHASWQSWISFSTCRPLY